MAVDSLSCFHNNHFKAISEYQNVSITQYIFWENKKEFSIFWNLIYIRACFTIQYYSGLDCDNVAAKKVVSDISLVTNIYDYLP